jgi:hypothetical protein
MPMLANVIEIEKRIDYMWQIVNSTEKNSTVPQKVKYF